MGTLGLIVLLAVQTKTVQMSKPDHYKVSAEIPTFGSGPVARHANDAIGTWSKRLVDTWLRDFNLSVHDLGKPRMPWELMAKTDYRYETPRLVSTAVVVYEFTGGAHGNTITNTFNFGLVGGSDKRLELGDFFTGKEYKTLVQDLLLTKLAENPDAAWVQDGTVRKFSVAQLNRFVVEPTGLRFYFDQYEVAPYSSGRFQVSLSAKDLGPTFRRSMLTSR
ncbi:MAG: hypothetical protein HONBIEJF_01522 [Fimbriimonadaceae bacterium]|nr:hypothetical protein [Fimbriimonadaceae bacterium]